MRYLLAVDGTQKYVMKVGTRHAKARKTIHQKALLGTKQRVSGNNRQLTCAKKLISDAARFFKNFMRQLCSQS